MIKSPENLSGKHLKKPFSPVGIAVLAGFLSVVGAIRSAVANNLDQEGRTTGMPSALVSPDASPNERKILEIEAAIEALEVQIEPVIDQYVRDTAMKTRLRAIFALFRSNKKNPNRFSPRGPVALGAEKGFNYQLVDESDNEYAAFSGSYRTILIPRNFDASDIVQLIQLIHEGSHVLDDNQRRKGDANRYKSYWESGDVIVAVPKSESDAMATALSAYRAYTRGRLCDARLQKKIIEKTTHDKRSAANILADSQVFCTGRQREFEKYVLEIYKKGKATLFTEKLEKL